MPPSWNPWRALRNRPHLRYARVPLPGEVGGAVLVPVGDQAVILIDPTLTRVERNAALAHELVHDERGGGVGWPGNPPGWDAVAARDETAVDREVARRLVPADDLRRWLAGPASLDLAVEAWQVAVEFDTTDAVAALALRLLDGDAA